MITLTDHDTASERMDSDPWTRHRRGSRESPTAKNLNVSLEWVLRNALENSELVDIDYSVLGGTPRIRGTRIPVYTILEAIEHHGDLNGALRAYPQLSIAQVKDAVLFAASVLECSVDGD